MKKIKVGYFADGPWGHNALDLLLSDSTIDIAFIVPRDDTNDAYLKTKASQYNIPYLTPVKVNSQEFYEVLLEYNCDLLVSMSFNQIFRERIINLPPLKIINCHAGKLPFYRGRNILNWVLINGEKEFGITVHYVDKGIDTGDIILQRTYPITDMDDYKSLLSVAYVECATILYDAIKLIQNNTIMPVVQNSIDKYGMYCGMRKMGDEIIDWNQSSEDLFNFIRAICKPGPMALSYVNGVPVYINQSIYHHQAVKYKGISGQIVGYEGDFPVVKTLDSILIISEYTSESKLKIGDRLTNG